MVNLPNGITLSRLVVIPLLFICFPAEGEGWPGWGLGLFLVAAATDWLDGYLARRLNQVTELGKFLDPLVDKLLVLAPLLILVSWQKVPAWAVGLILARELIIAGWRINPVLTQSQTISGANLWGKAKTVTQITAIALLLAPKPYDQWGKGVFWLALFLTIFSGIVYLIPAHGPDPKTDPS